MSPLPAEDRTRLLHIRDAASQALAFTEGKVRDDLDEDRLLELSLARLVEIIGEAAGHVTEATRRSTPTISWGQMRGMRNRLIHAYFNVDLDYLWQAVSEELPSLVEEIDRLLGEASST